VAADARVARWFFVIGCAWAALVPYALYVNAASEIGGSDVIIAVLFRAAVVVVAFVMARGVARGKPPVAPVAIATSYAAAAVFMVLVGIGRSASRGSPIGFMTFGGEPAGPSLAFPEMYLARYAARPGVMEGTTLLVAIVFAAANVVSAIRIRRGLSA
jgi:hypothetical protein